MVLNSTFYEAYDDLDFFFNGGTFPQCLLQLHQVYIKCMTNPCYISQKHNEPMATNIANGLYDQQCFCEMQPWSSFIIIFSQQAHLSLEMVYIFQSLLELDSRLSVFMLFHIEIAFILEQQN